MDKITANSIVFRYTHRTILHDVSLRVGQGEILSLLGPNGSGKTSLLKILLGLLRPDSGSVAIDGRPIDSMTPKEMARTMAYVPQFHRIAFSYRVLDVVLMGRLAHTGLFGRTTTEDEGLALAALERMGIAHLADTTYSEISGGERQLALIARALTQEARTLILDEPLNGLDYGNQLSVLEQISSLAAEGYTFVKTTHFPDHALWMSSRVILLHQGKIIADGHPHEVMNSRVLSSLYLADIALVPIGNGQKTCLPRSILDKKTAPGARTGRSLCAG